MRRYPRLALPAVASTALAWIISTTIGFHYDVIALLSGADMPNFFASIKSLSEAIWQGTIGAFFFGQTSYNEVLWTIRTELLGSFLIFVGVAIVDRIVPRLALYGIAIVLFFDSYLLGFVLGAICADVSARRRLQVSRWWWIVLLLGLYFGSYPYRLPEESIWLPVTLTLKGSAFIVSHIVGGALCILAVPMLPPIKRFFETGIAAFLGRISYSLYLVHFILWGSVGTAFTQYLQERQPYPAAALESFAMTIPIIAVVATLFTVIVDEPSVRLARKIPAFPAETERSTVAEGHGSE